MSGRISRRILLTRTGTGLAGLLCANLLGTPAGAGRRPPNFVVVLGEGHGWSSTWVQMDDAVPASKSAFVRTPDLEKLAAAGMRLASFYAASPRCTPTRAALLTGKSPAQLHMTFIGEGRRDTGENLNGRVIVRLGEERYPLGYQHFLEIMAATRAEVEAMAHGPATPLLGRRPLEAIHSAMSNQTTLRIMVMRDGDAIGICEVSELPYSVPSITPGKYQVVLDTGWMLWEGTLQSRQLMWAEAFPDRPLQAAAATEKPLSGPASYRQVLMDGVFELTVTPGVEAGVLSISRR